MASFFPRGRAAEHAGGGTAWARTGGSAHNRPTTGSSCYRHLEWPEQERYEQIRPLMLFDVSVAERAAEGGLSESTLYWKLNGFEGEGMESLFGSEPARRKRLPPAGRRLIVDLKAEYPAFNLNEIAT